MMIFKTAIQSVKDMKLQFCQYLRHIFVVVLSLSFSHIALAADICNSSGFSSADYLAFGSGKSGSLPTRTFPISGGDSATNGFDLGLAVNQQTGSISTSAITRTVRTGGYAAFKFDQIYVSNNSNEITFTFSKPLTNLNISVYDIDQNEKYLDTVEFSGTTSSNTTVLPTLATYSTKVKIDGNLAKSAVKGTNGDYNNTHRVTATFSTPVTKVVIRYGNTKDGGDQTIDVRFDSYCIADTTEPLDPPITLPDPVAGNVCPVGHTLYAVGSSASAFPSSAIFQKLTWTAAATEQKFSFSNNGYLVATVDQISGLQPPDGLYKVQTPALRTDADILNKYVFVRNKSNVAGDNHRFSVTAQPPTGWAVTKIGLGQYDLDGGAVLTPEYSVVSLGKSSLTSLITSAVNTDATVRMNPLENSRLALSLGNTRVDGTIQCRLTNNENGQEPAPNCGSVFAEWQANSLKLNQAGILSVTHGIKGTTDSFPHNADYNNFYFCAVKPATITIIKSVPEGHISPTDEFKVELVNSINPATVLTQGTTTLSGTTNNSQTVINKYTLTDVNFISNTYTIKEIAGNANTVLDNYDTTYQCTNSGTNTLTVTPSDTDRSFTLSGLASGNDVVCTIKNTPKKYKFSGIVFNDNGGITDPASQEYAGNADYFDGVYNSSLEKGISGSTIEIKECAGSTSVTDFQARSIAVNSDGTYNFDIPMTDIGDNKELCLTQTNPAGFPVDTTKDTLTVSLKSNQNSYPNNNFGQVAENQAALVLIKRHYVNDCKLTDLKSINVNDASGATVGYSTKNISDIKAGMCIAYRIDAINRGHRKLTNVVIEDILQKKGDKGATVTSTLFSPAPTSDSDITYAPSSLSVIGQNGTIVTNPFELPSASSKAIFFNTKYGTTQ